MSLKSIDKIIAPPPPHMVGDGFRMHGFFPNDIIDKKRMSPFFLMDYNARIDFSGTENIRGVGVHPHRGFETVTIVYHGKIAHHDSKGNSGVVEPGGVQWMTAGAGLLHKEYHEEGYSRSGGLFQMVQLWVNLPAKYKMAPPAYQDINRENMTVIDLPGETGIVELIAGSFAGKIGPAKTFTPIHLSNSNLNADSEINFQFPAKWNTGMLVVEGDVRVNGREVNQDHFVLFSNEGEDINVRSSSAAKLLVMSGEPINEPIAQYGPFLMNTWEEVEAAITDVSRGKFGLLE